MVSEGFLVVDLLPGIGVGLFFWRLSLDFRL